MLLAQRLTLLKVKLYEAGDYKDRFDKPGAMV